MSITPTLYVHQDGRMWAKIAFAGNEAAVPLPPHLQNATKEELEEFFQAFIPTAMRELVLMANTDRSKANKKRRHKL